MWVKPLFAVVYLTWKASVRYRFFWVMLVLLALAVGVLPLIVKDDGSAAGMTQILITYTLSMITAIMGAATLWISAGSLANAQRLVQACVYAGQERSNEILVSNRLLW